MKEVTRGDLHKISEHLYEIPKSFRSDMRVPAHFYADDDIVAKAFADRSLEQLVNTATLPGIVGQAMAMPDIHQGYGFPIGGVAATRLPDGVVSPGGVGYDINCGVRVMGTALDAGEVHPYLGRLADALYRHLPSGVGVKGHLHVNKSEMDKILAEGSSWAEREGYARREDVAHTEEGGCMSGADPAKVSKSAKERGLGQVGTLGSGNHFAEIDEVTEISHPEAAKAYVCGPVRLLMQLHCGSRGLAIRSPRLHPGFQRASNRFR
jgi:tRNA-splicing ligase RtcB